jgi:hypothetical protein
MTSCTELDLERLFERLFFFSFFVIRIRTMFELETFDIKCVSILEILHADWNVFSGCAVQLSNCSSLYLPVSARLGAPAVMAVHRPLSLT